MALYEDLDRQGRMTAIAYRQSHPRAAEAPALSWEDVVRTVRAASLAFLIVCWVAGAYAGIVYWSLQGSLLGVLASAVVGGIAATSTWWSYAALERSPGRQR